MRMKYRLLSLSNKDVLISCPNSFSHLIPDCYRFKFEELEFEDGLITEAVLLPLKMFEDIMKYFHEENLKNNRFSSYISSEPPKSSGYLYQQYKLGKWLQSNSLEQFKQ